MRLLLHDYGGYAFSLQLAEYLAGNGHQVTYLHGGCMQGVQRSRRVSRQKNLCIESAEVPGRFEKYSFIRRWQQEREYGRGVARRIAQARPDVVISANTPLDAQDMLLTASRDIGAQFIFWWQDVLGIGMRELLAQKYGIGGRLIGEYYRHMEARMLRGSDHIVAISDDFLPVAQAWGIAPQKISVLPNWAPIQDIPLLPKDNPWAREHGLQGKFVFLYAGVLGLKHDPQIFLSLAESFRANEDVAIVVVSEGIGADWLTKRQQELGIMNLCVLPFQPCEDYPAMLAGADVLLVTLNARAGSYSVPSKVLSYLCAGRPVLLSAAAQNPAARSAIEYGFGSVVRPGDADGLCAAAHELYECQDLRHRLGNNARAYAESAFDIRKIAGQFMELLQPG